MWAGLGHSKIYFDATTGGAANLGQVGEYDPGRETLTLIYESTSSSALQSPDNVVVVPIYVNQQDERGGLPFGPEDGNAVTYAIYGPF